MTNKKYDLIIFDWAGTIIDSPAHISQTMQMAITNEGLTLPSQQSIRHIIGLSLSRAIEELFPEIEADAVQRVADGYRDHFFKETTAASELFEGVADVIKDLHAEGYYLAVATGKGRHGLDMALQSSGLEPFFHITRCADETRSKPDPLMLDEILADLVYLSYHYFLCTQKLSHLDGAFTVGTSGKLEGLLGEYFVHHLPLHHLEDSKFYKFTANDIRKRG